jgi:hypothetical protein
MSVVDEIDYLCRLCATKMGILMGLPIFEANEQMRNIDKKISACLPVQVKLIIIFIKRVSMFILPFYTKDLLF